MPSYCDATMLDASVLVVLATVAARAADETHVVGP